MPITTTALKHTNILSNSRGIMGSLSMQKATKEIQKGLVYHMTMIRASGARGAATLSSKKFPCPLRILTKSVPF